MTAANEVPCKENQKISFVLKHQEKNKLISNSDLGGRLTQPIEAQIFLSLLLLAGEGQLTKLQNLRKDKIHNKVVLAMREVSKMFSIRESDNVYLEKPRRR